MNPVLALVIANIIWGAASPIFKFSLTNIPPFTLAFIRFFFAALIFIPFLKKSDFTKLNLRDWFAIVMGGAFLGIFVNITFFFLGIQKTDSINVPVIASSGPLLMFLMSGIFLKEKMRIKVFAGMMTALLGVIIIVAAPLFVNGKTIGDLSQVEGNLMIVLATFGSILFPLFLKRVLTKVGSTTVTFLTFIISSFFFLPFIFHEFASWSFSDLNIAGITGIIYGVFFSSALAFYLYNFGISKIEIQEVGIFTYIDPVVAILIAAPLLGEYPDIYYVWGSVFIFLGIYISEGRIHYHPFNKIKVLIQQLRLSRSKLEV